MKIIDEILFYFVLLTFKKKRKLFIKEASKIGEIVGGEDDSENLESIRNAATWLFILFSL